MTIIANNNSGNPEISIDDKLALIESTSLRRNTPLDAARIIRESFREKQRDSKNEMEK